MSKIIAASIVSLHHALAPLREALLLTFFGHASHCRHHPTCSQYFLRQVQRYGWSGFYRGFKRLLTCY